jgi:thioredoxin reductase
VNRTVDLVIVGEGGSVRDCIIDALKSGRRVLVVMRAADARAGRRLRAWLRRREIGCGGQLMVMTEADVVCVDGVGGIEAVVIRHARSGRVCAVNASALLCCN